MEKKNNAKTIIIVILSLIVIGLSGFIIYDKFMKEKPKPKIIQPKDKEQKENLDEIAQKLMDKIETYKVDYYDKKQDIDFKTIDEEELSRGAFAYSQGKEGSMKQNIENYYLNLFNKKLSNYPNIECHAGDGTLYRYDSETDEYVKDCGKTESCHAHGGLCVNNSLFMNYKSIEKEGNNYIIAITKVYGPSQGICFETPENAFYTDSQYTIRLDELTQFTKTDNNGNYGEPDIDGAYNYYIENYNKFKDIEPYYIYTFEKINNDYYLTKVKKIN